MKKAKYYVIFYNGYSSLFIYRKRSGYFNLEINMKCSRGRCCFWNTLRHKDIEVLLKFHNNNASILFEADSFEEAFNYYNRYSMTKELLK